MHSYSLNERLNLSISIFSFSSFYLKQQDVSYFTEKICVSVRLDDKFSRFHMIPKLDHIVIVKILLVLLN